MQVGCCEISTQNPKHGIFVDVAVWGVSIKLRSYPCAIPRLSRQISQRPIHTRLPCTTESVERQGKRLETERDWSCAASQEHLQTSVKITLSQMDLIHETCLSPMFIYIIILSIYFTNLINSLYIKFYLLN